LAVWVSPSILPFPQGFPEYPKADMTFHRHSGKDAVCDVQTGMKNLCWTGLWILLIALLIMGPFVAGYAL